MPLKSVHDVLVEVLGVDDPKSTSVPLVHRPVPVDLIPTDPIKPPRFDPYRIAASPAMQCLVDELTDMYLRVEKVEGKRKRRRRPADMKVFRSIVEAVLCDLHYQHAIGHASLRITRRREDLARATRYSDAVLSEQLPAILDFMETKMGMIEQTLGYQSQFGNRQTEIAATPWLRSKFTERSLTIFDVDRREGEELVLLKGTKIAGGRAELAEYEDDDYTHQARVEVQTINRYLRGADIDFTSDLAGSGLLVDPRHRYLRRIFTRGTFGSGGRLFGGFWQPIAKTERLANVIINGEPVVSIDYSSMLATLSYAYVGQPPPETEAYITTFMGADHEPITLSRQLVKQLFAACLFAEAELKQWPGRMSVHAKGLPVSTVIAGIKAAHPALVPLFFRGLGHTMQYAESEILVDVMLRLIEEDIPALPVHDCVVVPESALEITKAHMLDIAQWHQHVPFKVHVETA